LQRIDVLARELRSPYSAHRRTAQFYLDHVQRLTDQLDQVSAQITKEIKDYTLLPIGLRLTRLLYMTSGDTKPLSLDGKLRQFYADRFYEPRLREQPLSYEVAAALLDNGIPFLVKGGQFGDSTLVCFGYFTLGTDRNLIVGDPSEIDVVEISHADLVEPPREGEPERIAIHREMMKAGDKTSGKIQTDYEFQIETADGTRGIRLVKWQEGSTMLILPVPQPSNTLLRELLERHLAPYPIQVALRPRPHPLGGPSPVSQQELAQAVTSP
jgi:hypothetical protein